MCWLHWNVFKVWGHSLGQKWRLINRSLERLGRGERWTRKRSFWREKVSEWKISRLIKKVKQSREEYGAILRCMKARHLSCRHWTPYLGWDPVLRWYISQSDSVRLEGSFEKWRPVSLSVKWDHGALVAAHLPGKSTYLPLVQTYKSRWG